MCGQFINLNPKSGFEEFEGQKDKRKQKEKVDGNCVGSESSDYCAFTPNARKTRRIKVNEWLPSREKFTFFNYNKYFYSDLIKNNNY